MGLQIEYSLLERTVERDLVPMAEHFGLSVVGWAPLGAGVLTGKYTRGGDLDSRRQASNDARGRTSEASLAIAREVDAVADEVGASSAQVAIAWVQAQGYGMIPIVGARKVSQITDSLGASAVTLSVDQLARLDAVSRVSLGFPHAFLASDGVLNMVRGEQVRPRLDPRPGT